MIEVDVQLLRLRKEGDFVGRRKNFGLLNRRTYVLVTLRRSLAVWRLAGYEDIS